MADRRGASNLGIPLMLGTLVLLGGFLYWLATTAEPTPPPVMEEEPEEQVGPAATVAQLDTLERNAPRYEGQMIRVENVAVAQNLGTASFFVSLPGGSPFMAVYADNLVAAGEPVPTGEVTLTGRVHPAQDSLLDVWIESGVVSEANRPLAEFASHYLEVASIVIGAQQGGGEGDSGEGNADGGDADAGN